MEKQIICLIFMATTMEITYNIGIIQYIQSLKKIDEQKYITFNGNGFYQIWWNRAIQCGII